jgi:uncharacterized protein YndB with AHSA1/START domain
MSASANEQPMKFGTIKQVVVFDATPQEVYEAYVDPKKQAAFTGTAVTGTPKVGGKFYSGDGYITAKYTKLQPGKKIVHEWTTTEWPAGYPPSILELTLKPKGKGTELTMVHSKVPTEQVDYYAEGWKQFYWAPLKKYFAAKRTSKK